MIQIDGALRVKKILQSKNGPFAVGTLTTGVGVFKVKDQMLDAFDEGDYQVSASIAEIYLGQYVYSGRSITEIRASLGDLKVRAEQPLDEPLVEQDMEPDPLDEPPRLSARSTRPPPAASAPQQEPEHKPSTVDALKARLKGLGRKSPTAKPEADRAQPAGAPTSSLDTASATFSEDLWALIQNRQPVKLDATIDRARYREQSQLLRERFNYKFHPMDQTFHPL